MSEPTDTPKRPEKLGCGSAVYGWSSSRYNGGSACNGDGEGKWGAGSRTGGHWISARAWNEMPCHTDGVSSVTPVHVDSDVTQGVGLGVKRKAMSRTRRAGQAVVSPVRFGDMTWSAWAPTAYKLWGRARNKVKFFWLQVPRSESGILQQGSDQGECSGRAWQRLNIGGGHLNCGQWGAGGQGDAGTHGEVISAALAYFSDWQEPSLQSW